MDEQSKPEKSTGALPSGAKERENESLLPVFTESKKESPALSNARSKEESSISTGVHSERKNILANLLAIQVLIGDFQGVKRELPTTRIASSNGKLYFSIEIPGILLAIDDGNLLVDGKPLEKILAERAGKSTGGK